MVLDEGARSNQPFCLRHKSAARFADYEQAMDEGFEALKELRCPQNARLL